MYSKISMWWNLQNVRFFQIQLQISALLLVSGEVHKFMYCNK